MQWALYKTGIDKIVTTVESDTSKYGGKNASVDSELEHKSSTSKPN